MECTGRRLNDADGQWLWKVSATICTKNQALNEYIDKVIRIPRKFSLIGLFVLKAGFASEWLIFLSYFCHSEFLTRPCIFCMENH
jgi:hypothetical protein